MILLCICEENVLVFVWNVCLYLCGKKQSQSLELNRVAPPLPIEKLLSTKTWKFGLLLSDSFLLSGEKEILSNHMYTR